MGREIHSRSLLTQITPRKYALYIVHPTTRVIPVYTERACVRGIKVR